MPDVTVSLDDPTPVDETDDESAINADIPADEEEPNLALKWGKGKKGQEKLKEVGDKIVDDFDEAFTATEGYREKMAKAYKMFSGDLEPKTFPFKGCANVNVPILLENIPRVTLRAYSELFSDDTWFKYSAPSGEDTIRAKACTEHTAWQFRTTIPDFYRQQHRGLLMFFMNGDVGCHSYYDDTRQHIRHEMLTPDELVLPYVHTTTMPDYSDVPWLVRVYHKYKHDLERMKKAWNGVDKVLENTPTLGDEPENKTGDAQAESRGVEKTDEMIAPYKLLWFEGTLDVGLGKKTDVRFVRALVDYATRTVLHLSYHEEDDWQDKAREIKQQAEMEQYLDARGRHAQALQLEQMKLQDAQSLQTQLVRPGAQQMGQEMMQQTASQVVALQAQAPVPPKWMLGQDELSAKPKPAKRVAIHLFSHFVNIEPLVGNLGFGHGRSQMDFNIGANTVVNQAIDQATLGNTKTFLVPDTFELTDSVKIVPGTFNKVPGLSMDEIKNSLTPLDFGAANPQLMQFAQTFYTWSQTSMQAPDILSGSAGKSGETARGVMERIGQATKQLSVETQKYAGEGLTQILKNNAKLNAKHLPDEEVFYVTDKYTKLVTQGTVSKDFYNLGFTAEVRADLRFQSKDQKVKEADDAFGMITKTPQLAGNAALVYWAVRKSLEARGFDDAVPMLGPVPDAPVMPMGSPPPMPPGAPPGPPAAPPPPGGPTPPQPMGAPEKGKQEPMMPTGKMGQNQPAPPSLSGPGAQPGVVA